MILALEETVRNGAKLEFIPRKNKVIFKLQNQKPKRIKLDGVRLSEYFRKRFILNYTGELFEAKLTEPDLIKEFHSPTLLGVLTAVRSLH